mmetsp:Transcript_43247/g.136582  ORF Transcript_43247/g.136582 Transcript_43247/m.136582 type:complete len:234 (+) Transcript_43247:935-1636(+)
MAPLICQPPPDLPAAILATPRRPPKIGRAWPERIQASRPQNRVVLAVEAALAEESEPEGERGQTLHDDEPWPVVLLGHVAHHASFNGSGKAASVLHATCTSGVNRNHSLRLGRKGCLQRECTSRGGRGVAPNDRSSHRARVVDHTTLFEIGADILHVEVAIAVDVEVLRPKPMGEEGQTVQEERQEPAVLPNQIAGRMARPPCLLGSHHHVHAAQVLCCRGDHVLTRRPSSQH